MAKINDVVNFFNQKNREFNEMIRNTEEYKKYQSYTGCDRHEAYELQRAVERVQYDEGQKLHQTLAEYLINATTFKDGSPYIEDLAISVEGQKLVFGGQYSLRAGEVASIYKKWLKEKNAAAQKTCTGINVGDIYVWEHFEEKRFFKISKISDKSVTMDELGLESVGTDFDADKFTACIKDSNNYELTRNIFEFGEKYYEFNFPGHYYVVNETVRPTDEVIDSFRMTVTFEKGKTIFRNKKQNMDISEKYDGTPVVIKRKVSHFGYERILDKAVVECMKAGHEASREIVRKMTEEYRNSEEGKRERAELEEKLRQRKIEVEAFNKEHAKDGIEVDVNGGISIRLA